MNNYIQQQASKICALAKRQMDATHKLARNPVDCLCWVMTLCDHKR